MAKTLQDYLNEGYEVVKQPEKEVDAGSLNDLLSQGYEVATPDDLKQYTQSKLQNIKNRLAEERETTLDPNSQSYKDIFNSQPTNDMATTTQPLQPQQPQTQQSIEPKNNGYNDLSPTMQTPTMKNIDTGKMIGDTASKVYKGAKDVLTNANNIDNNAAKSFWSGVQKGTSDLYKLFGFSNSKVLNKIFVEPGEKVYQYNQENNPLPKTVNNILSGFGKLAFDIPTTIGTGAGAARAVEGKVADEVSKLLADHSFAVGSFLQGVEKSAQKGNTLGKVYEDGLYNASQAEVYQHIGGKGLKNLAKMMGAGATFAATDKVKNGQPVTADDIAKGATEGAAIHLIFRGMDLAEKGLTSASEKLALKYAKKKFAKYADEYMKASEAQPETEQPKPEQQPEPQAQEAEVVNEPQQEQQPVNQKQPEINQEPMQQQPVESQQQEPTMQQPQQELMPNVQPTSQVPATINNELPPETISEIRQKVQAAMPDDSPEDVESVVQKVINRVRNKMPQQNIQPSQGVQQQQEPIITPSVQQNIEPTQVQDNEQEQIPANEPYRPIKAYRGGEILDKVQGNGNLGSGVYLSDKKDIAKNFGSVTEAEIPKGEFATYGDKISLQDRKEINKRLHLGLSKEDLEDTDDFVDFYSGFVTPIAEDKGISQTTLGKVMEDVTNKLGIMSDYYGSNQYLVFNPERILKSDNKPKEVEQPQNKNVEPQETEQQLREEEKENIPKNVEFVDEIPEEIKKPINSAVKFFDIKNGGYINKSSDGYIGSPFSMIKEDYLSKNFKNYINKQDKSRHNNIKDKLEDVIPRENLNNTKQINPKNYVGFGEYNGNKLYIYKHNNEYISLDKAKVDYITKNVKAKDLNFRFIDDESPVGIYDNNKFIGVVMPIYVNKKDISDIKLLKTNKQKEQKSINTEQNITKNNKLELLQKQLKEKQALFDKKLSEHISTVKQSNGQPLNDKRNGQSTINKWNRQEQSLRKLENEINRLKDRIEEHKGTQLEIEEAKNEFPKPIKDLIDKGILTQWSKYPNTLFVKGVEKARIKYDKKKGIVTHKYTNQIKSKEEFEIFKKTFNDLKSKLDAIKSETKNISKKQPATSSLIDTQPPEVKKEIERNTPKTAEEETYNATTSEKDEPMPKRPPMYMHEKLPEKPVESIKIGEHTIKQPDKVIYPVDIKNLYRKLVGDIFYSNNLSNDKLGQYSQLFGSVRSRPDTDVEVIAHEIGHYFQFNKAVANKFADFINRNDNEIKQYSYTKKENLVLAEGFAELVRAYFTRNKDIEPALYNKLDDAFKSLGKDKYKLVKKIQQQSHFYYHQGHERITQSAIAPDKGFKDKLLDFAMTYKDPDKHITEFFDAIHPIKMMMNDAGQPDDFSEKNIYTVANNIVYGWRGTVEAIAKYGTAERKKNGELHFTGESLSDVFNALSPKLMKRGEAIKTLNDFYKYMQLRQSLYQATKQDRKSPFGSVDVMKSEIARLKKQYPNFPKVHLKWLRFNKRMLDFYVSNHLISEDTKKLFLKSNPLYVPQHRDISASDSYGSSNSFKKRSKTGSTRRLKGVVNLVEPIENSIKMAEIAYLKYRIVDFAKYMEKGAEWLTEIKPGTAKYTAMAEQQASHFMKMLDEYDMGISEDGSIIPKDETTTETTLSQVKDYLKKHPDALNFYMGGVEPYSVDGQVFSVVDDKGKVKYYEISKNSRKGQLLIRTLEAATDNIPVIQPFVFVRNFFTRAIVGMPHFIFPNIFRDTATLAAYSNVNAKPGIDTAKGIVGFAKADDDYKMIMLNGASASTVTEGYTETGKRNKMLADSVKIASVSKVMNAYDKIIGAFEIANRLGEAKVARKKGANWQAATRMFSEVTTNFSRFGANKLFRSVSKTVAFLSAYMNSLFKDAIKFGGKDMSIDGSQKMSILRLMTKGFIYITIPSLIMTLYTMSDKKREEEYANLPPYVGALNEVFTLFGHTITIPEPWLVGTVFSKAPETALRLMAGKHGKKALEELILGLKVYLGTDMLPSLTRPVYNLQVNKDFRDMPIVPDRLKNLTGKYSYLQYKYYTPLVYRDIAKKLSKVGINVSPIKMQYLFDNYFGYIARVTEGATQSMLWDKKKMGVQPYDKDSLFAQVEKRFVRPDYGHGYYTWKYWKLMPKVRAVRNAFKVTKAQRYLDKGESYTELKKDMIARKIEQRYKSYSNLRSLISKSYKRSYMINQQPNLTAKEKEKRLKLEANYRDNLYKRMYNGYNKILKED